MVYFRTKGQSFSKVFFVVKKEFASKIIVLRFWANEQQEEQNIFKRYSVEVFGKILVSFEHQIFWQQRIVVILKLLGRTRWYIKVAVFKFNLRGFF